jgi:hypothetical protein
VGSAEAARRVVACPCCQWRYTIGTGEWYQHECAGPRMAPHRWLEAWCLLDRPTNGVKAAPRDGACGKCPRHCRCSSRQRNNLPAVAKGESVQQFVARLLNSKTRLPHKNDE